MRGRAPALPSARGRTEAEPAAALPPGLHAGAGDPLRWAAALAGEAFLDRPAAVARDPAAAARAAALVEFLATAAQDPRLPDSPWLTRLLREGRAVLRGAVGLTGAAAPQAALDALLAAAAGDPARLRALAAPGVDPVAGLAGLAAPPALARALRALRDALAASRGPP